MDKLTVVFDLDQTLVFVINLSRVQQQQQHTYLTTSSSFIVNIKDEQYWVLKRPGLDEFLKLASQVFQLVCFTASCYEYANTILDVLDPTGTIFHQRFFRHHCVSSPWFPGAAAKDLTILKNVSLNRVVSVYDLYESFIQMYNASKFLLFEILNKQLTYIRFIGLKVPIKPFTGNMDDTALFNLSEFLNKCNTESDVRPLLRQTFLMDKFALQIATIVNKGKKSVLCEEENENFE
jgi:RNA polymerase II subunit A small phosphatase-like protein